jgi:hypothetical protein
MKTFPILYKKTATGATQQWSIFVENDRYWTESGQVDGLLTESKPTICYGKNIGKSNETDGEAQAILEAEAKITKKLKTGYTEDVTKIDTCKTYFSPMLACKYVDKKDKVKFPVLVSRKIDGCLSGDTMVEFEDNQKMCLRDVFNAKPNKLIKTYNKITKKVEYKRILNYMKNLNDVNEKDIQWYRITLKNGVVVKATGNHRVYIQKLSCWRRIDELAGDEGLLYKKD